MIDNCRLNGFDFINSYCQSEPLWQFKGTDRREFDDWKAEISVKLKKLLGFEKIKDCPLNPQKIASEDNLETGSGLKYSREKWVIDTAQGLSMCMFVLIPQNADGKTAIAIHSHGSDGKNAIVGIICEEMQRLADKYQYTYAMDLLEKGYIVFCPDLLGSDERKFTDKNKSSSDCDTVNFSLLAVGLNLQGIITYELIKLVDFILSFDNIINIETLTCVGFSGGAVSALWLAALDERVKTVYLSGYFHSFKDTLYQSNFCGCNFIPNLWELLDMDALAMMTAPRKLYIETGCKDTLNGRHGIGGVEELVKKTEWVYKNIFDSDSLKFTVCEDAHKWYGAFMEEI